MRKLLSKLSSTLQWARPKVVRGGQMAMATVRLFAGLLPRRTWETIGVFALTFLAGWVARHYANTQTLFGFFLTGTVLCVLGATYSVDKRVESSNIPSEPEVESN